MHGADNVSAALAGYADVQKNTATRFSLGRICRSMRNCVTTFSSYHRFPRNLPEICCQSLSNLRTFLDACTHGNPHGIATPPLAAAQRVVEWFFWQQQHQATCQLLQLIQTTSDHAALNDYFYALNTLALSGDAGTPGRIQAYIDSRAGWRNSLRESDHQQAGEFEQRLIACLEKRAFWQPRPTLLQPLIKWAAPYCGMYLDEVLAIRAPALSPCVPGQQLNASRVIAGEVGQEEDLFFGQGKNIIYVPGSVSLPTLMLTSGQEFCTQLTRCPTELLSYTGNRTVSVEMAGVGTADNEKITLCINNKKFNPLFINRDLNTRATWFPSQIYRHSLQVGDANPPQPDDACCPVISDVSGGALHRVNWGGILPVAAAEERGLGDDQPQPQINEYHFRHYAEVDIPTHSPSAYDPDAIATPNNRPFRHYAEVDSFVLPLTTMLPEQLIPYEVDLSTWERSKRMFIPLKFPFLTRTTTTTPRATGATPVTTPDSLTLLFGPTNTTLTPGSCRTTQPVLIGRDLDVMLAKAQQWLRQVPSTQIDDKIHTYFLNLEGVADAQFTSLEEIVTVVRKLVTGIDSQYAYDQYAAVDFAALLFEGSCFAEVSELLNAWVGTSAGKAQLSEILLRALDRAIPNPGLLVSATLKALEQKVRPETTLFASLPDVKVELQNGFKSNLVASVYYARGPLPDFIQSHVILGKLQFLHLEYIKNQYPFFRLCSKPDVMDKAVLSTHGVLLTVAAGLIADDDKLHYIPADRLERFGMQAMLRHSDDFLLDRFAYFDRLLAKGDVRLADYLNHLEAEGGLLVRLLYLNLKIYNLLQHGGKLTTQFIIDYQALAGVEKQLCTLALGQIEAADQAFFLAASQQPGGLEVRFITAENKAAHGKQRHYIGFTLTAGHENIRRCYTLSIIPKINNIIADVVYNDTQHSLQADDYARWINHAGKTTFMTRLSVSNRSLPDITFNVSDKMTAPVARSQVQWSLYAQSLSQFIINQRFPPVVSVSTTTSAPGIIDEIMDVAGNLISQFISLKSCKQAFDAIRDRPATIEEALITAEYAALCFYDSVPESETGKLVNEASYAVHSVAEKVIALCREEIQHKVTPADTNPINMAELQEQLFLDDSQVTARLANSIPFQAYLGWMLRDKSFSLRPLAPQVTILDVRWNVITDRFYCKANTPQGIKNYRVDEQNALLLPTHHQFTDNFANSQERVVDAEKFVSHVASGTLDDLKTERMEQDIRETNKYDYVLFKKYFTEIDFSNDNVRDVFFSNLIINTKWQPVHLWVKKGSGGDDFIIVEFKDEKEKTHYKQMSKRDEVLIDWKGDPTRIKRVTREATTLSPYYVNMFTPLHFGYQEVNQYTNVQREAELRDLIEEGSKIPDPGNLPESRCRDRMEELLRLTPFSFIKLKFPVVSQFVEQFARWETPVIINDKFNQFVDAVEQYHRENHTEVDFYERAKKSFRISGSWIKIIKYSPGQIRYLKRMLRNIIRNTLSRKRLSTNGSMK
ncbi:hypothetical protein [Pantoea sp. App145]|uniref:hypothetical protein n=1 Tax=Pantoea sp. App145 TaxID=3071567 RepID=UPI003A80E4FF